MKKEEVHILMCNKKECCNSGIGRIAELRCIPITNITTFCINFKIRKKPI